MKVPESGQPAGILYDGRPSTFLHHAYAHPTAPCFDHQRLHRGVRADFAGAHRSTPVARDSHPLQVGRPRAYFQGGAR